jgi:RimJ/RimL family protein N-acetyltransferase/DNA-binding transcriptional regulator YbjK
MDADRRERIIAVAAELFAEYGVVNTSRHDIARAAEVSLRSINAVGDHRIDLLREVLERLPETPVAETMKRQASDPSTPAMETLLTAAHDILGDPTRAWDPRELQAMVAAPHDEALRGLVGARLERRWKTAREVLRQLRMTGELDDTVDAEAAVLHVLAVGVGLAILAPLIPAAHDVRAWTALAARLLESISAADPELAERPRERVWRVRLSIAEGPSAIAHLTRVLSLLDVSLVSLSTASAGRDSRRQSVDVIVRSATDTTRSMLIDALSSVGTDVVVGRGEGVDADDVAARVLELSTRLLANPDYAPQAAADLLLADSWEVVEASVGEDSSPTAARLQWSVDRHVIVRRESAPFTAGEYGRASALLELLDAVTVARGTPGFGWRDLLVDGMEVVTRLARPEDTAGVEALHARCSAASLFQRYFTPKNTWREENLRRISGGHRGSTLVVTSGVDAHGEDEVVAIGNIFPLDPQDTSLAEVALLVDDAWHGRGIGRLLLAHLLETAPRLGFDEIVAYVLPDNQAMQALLDPQQWRARSAPDLGAGATAFHLRLSTDESGGPDSD